MRLDLIWHEIRKTRDLRKRASWTASVRSDVRRAVISGPRSGTRNDEARENTATEWTSPNPTPSEINPFHDSRPHLSTSATTRPTMAAGFGEAGMDGGETLDERTLRRIIATLVALAALAERAAGRSFPVRWLVLALLRYAETVARDYVVETAPWAWPYLEDELEPGSSPMDAVLLGQRLRMLAAVLGALLPAEDQLDCWITGHDHARHRLASGVLLFVVQANGRRPAFHDTS